MNNDLLDNYFLAMPFRDKKNVVVAVVSVVAAVVTVVVVVVVVVVCDRDLLARFCACVAHKIGGKKT